MMPSGGKRKGAGAKPLPPELKKQPYCIKLDPELLRYIRSLDNGSGEIDRCLRASKRFREWRRSQD